MKLDNFFSKKNSSYGLFLLDAKYNKENNKTLLVFYDPHKEELVHWIETSDHKPYLITSLNVEEINKIKEVVNSKGFCGIDTVEKINPFTNKVEKYSKVFGETPLEIGGTSGSGRTSFRENIHPSYEANIRYHLNFLADAGLTPATFYKISEKGLEPQSEELGGETRKEIEGYFKKGSDDEYNMLNSYLPQLFQDIPDIRRAAYDIEIDSDENQLPNAIKAEFPIISIALVSNRKEKKIWVLNRELTNQNYKKEGVDIIKCESEEELLLGFFDEICKYSMIVSFNGDNFDNPYLHNRAKKIGIANPPIKIERNETSIGSSIHLDLYPFFKQASIKTYAFGGAYDRNSLEDIANGLIGIGKIEHSKTWINKMELKDLVDYNIRDVEITLKLTTYKNNLVINLIFTLMRVCKLPFTDFTRQSVSSWLKFWLIWEHRKKGILIPSRNDILALSGEGHSQALIEGKKFQGAIVIDPEPGVWWGVQVWDFASLYPSIIKTRNLSYETMNCPHESCKENKVPGLNHTVCNKKTGIMALMLGFVRDLRVQYFKPKKREKDEFAITEQALKVLINAGYGVIGSDKFDFFCLPAAESTTAFAREAITKIKKFVEEELQVKVLYGDTDSLFIMKLGKEKEEEMKKWSIENLGIEIGLDYDFRYILFSNLKKNYLGVTNQGKAIVKGMMGKKKNTPRLLRECFSHLLQILGKIESSEELKTNKKIITKLIKDLIGKIKSGDLEIEDVVIRTTLSHKLKNYKMWTQPIQAIAQLIEKDIPGARKIDVGDQIEYVQLKNKINVVIKEGSPLAFPPEIRQATVKPVQLVDTKKEVLGNKLEDLAESVFAQIIQPLGINWKKDIQGQKSISDFF